MVPTGGPKRMTNREFAERLKTLIESNAAGNAQLLSRFLDLIKEVSEIRTGGSGNQPDVEALLSRWCDFNLAAYSVISTQGLALLNGLLTVARNTLITKETEARATAAPRTELRLSGRRGERATAGFVIDNRFDLPLAIMLESTGLTPAEGPALPSSLVSFEPSSVMIPPHGEAGIQAAITIAADFVIGQTYTGAIRLLGFGEFGEKELGLSLSVLPAEAEDAASLVAKPEATAPAPSRPAREPRRPAKKKALAGKK